MAGVIPGKRRAFLSPLSGVPRFADMVSNRVNINQMSEIADECELYNDGWRNYRRNKKFLMHQKEKTSRPENPSH
jgi:hypothetical protein